jgi:cytochrome P450
VLRRRALLKTFSPQVVETYEPIIRVHVNRLREQLGVYCDKQETLNLSKAIYACVCDIIGDLFLGHDYNVQHSGEPHRFADEHNMAVLASVSGAWPVIQPLLNLIVLLLPHPRTWRLKRWRNTLSYIFETRDRIKKRQESDAEGGHDHRMDALSRLLETVYYPTAKSDEKLSTDQLVAEVFAFL